MAKGSKQDEMQAIIVKKVIKKGGGHHGGAWKVAYADFVTAMMAFFLLLWLLNVSTDEALEVISSYFDPSHPRIADTRSGSGGVLGGLSMQKEGSMATSLQKMVQPETTGYKKGDGDGKKGDIIKQLEEELRKQENARFQQAKAELEQTLQGSEELRELAKHLQIDVTEEGLRIQIIDQEGRPMFASGSADMLPHTKTLMDLVAEAIKSMPNDTSIRGHTDSAPYPAGATYTNWELSADRANTARRVLLADGIEPSRMDNVMGKADREPFVPDNPLDAKNRRISIIMLRESVEQAYERGAFDDRITDDMELEQDDFKAYDSLPMINDEPTTDFQKTPGQVYFP